MTNQRVILHLSLIDGIGPAVIQALIGKKTDVWQWCDLHTLSVSEFRLHFGFLEKVSRKIKEGLSDRAKIDNELELIEKCQIKMVTILDDDYPELLKHIHLPPSVLYVQGANLNSFDKSMAVVGSRAMNWYGKQAIDILLPSLVQEDFAIVSGGARGVDSCAHRAALDNSGKTIAVLGSGLLRPYPTCNKKLFKEIVDKGGAVVSSFPLNMDALPGNFPARNRIISGLSLGCLVVQAAKKSGAGITARFALEQGRDVFAIPGQIDDSLSVGCHKLIQSGAKLVYLPDDILEEYEWLKPQKNCKRSSQAGSGSLRKHINPEFAKILSHCSNPVAIDDLSAITGINVHNLHEYLFEMQVQGIVSQCMGLWQRS